MGFFPCLRKTSYIKRLEKMFSVSAIASATSLRMSGWSPSGPADLLTLSPVSLFATELVSLYIGY